jgi:hypothetical protein
VRLAAALFSAMLLAGCAYVGDVKPPALDIPSRVTDLRAAEYGGNILVEFTIPPLTTEGLALTGVKAVELRVAAGATVQTLNLPAKGPGPANHQFPAQDWVGKQIALTIRATGPKGKTSEPSNTATLAVVPPLATPMQLQAAAAPQGVRLTWQGAGPKYRIFRGMSDATPTMLADSNQPDYVDATAEFGYPYKYFVQALDGEQHQSEVSETVSITPLDTFPPSVPAGLTAVAGVNSIELAWERNTEDDFLGYNLYRSVDGGPFERIAGPIDAPTYSDRQVMAGRIYTYAVTALDKAGNESARSMPAEATAQ